MDSVKMGDITGSRAQAGASITNNNLVISNAMLEEGFRDADTNRRSEIRAVSTTILMFGAVVLQPRYKAQMPKTLATPD